MDILGCLGVYCSTTGMCATIHNACVYSSLWNQVQKLGSVPGVFACVHEKHARVLMGTMWSIVATNARDNRQSLSHVGSRKVRGTEWGENIQSNFVTASAQSTNTKASLQADPCWRLELIHSLHSRGERRQGGKVRRGWTKWQDHQGKELRWNQVLERWS